MSESKGKILFVILAILLLLFGGGTILYPSLNGLWVERTMHRDSEDFLLLLEEDAERTAEENSHVIPGDPGTRETAEPQMPLEHTQLWLDIFNCLPADVITHFNSSKLICPSMGVLSASFRFRSGTTSLTRGSRLIARLNAPQAIHRPAQSVALLWVSPYTLHLPSTLS